MAQTINQVSDVAGRIVGDLNHLIIRVGQANQTPRVISYKSGYLLVTVGINGQPLRRITKSFTDSIGPSLGQNAIKRVVSVGHGHTVGVRDDRLPVADVVRRAPELAIGAIDTGYQSLVVTAQS